MMASLFKNKHKIHLHIPQRIQHATLCLHMTHCLGNMAFGQGWAEMTAATFACTLLSVE